MDFVVEKIIPITSIVLSSIAIVLTLKNENTKRFKLDIELLDKNLVEWNVDRTSNKFPDRYYQFKYRLFPFIVITNNSSLPVTITSFSLNKKYSFGVFTKVGDRYESTVQTNLTRKGNITFVSDKDEIKHGISLAGEPVLNPVFTIPPYESVAGLLFFMFDESLIGKNTITVKTSRGIKEFPIIISSQYNSQLLTDYSPPPLI